MRKDFNGALILDYQTKNQLFPKARFNDWMNMSSTRVIGGNHSWRKSKEGSLLDRYVNEFRGASKIIA
jgi:hypothetical protein